MRRLWAIALVGAIVILVAVMILSDKAPDKPKEGELYYYISFEMDNGYSSWNQLGCEQGGAWRTESEIRQVVAALREVFK